MKQIGVVEGFFGPEWPQADRLSYAEFIQQTGGGFYIYAPKRDPKLRKQWRDPWNQEYLSWLKSMAQHFKSHHVTFGVGLSPFGLGSVLTKDDEKILQQKMQQLSHCGVEIVGLFFDDMPSDASLARAQIACVNFIRREFNGKIVFCPSYYTPDPILEKVFGKMPENYWQDISVIPVDVSMAWTGPKVISPEIPVEHVTDTMKLLKRRPFIWENIFANDGPKNCKFLKLKPFTGRAAEVSKQVEAYAFNMMNQPHLSKILFLASRLVLEGKQSPDQALDQAMTKLCSRGLANFLMSHKEAYLQQGLDLLSTETKTFHQQELAKFAEPMAIEVIAWLRGNYVVGPECLTD